MTIYNTKKSRLVYYINVGDDHVEINKADISLAIKEPNPSMALRTEDWGSDQRYWESESFKTIPEMDGECEDEIGKVQDDIYNLRVALRTIAAHEYEAWVSMNGAPATRADLEVLAQSITVKKGEAHDR